MSHMALFLFYTISNVSSDGVLNPHGIRFGSSDIYSVVEAEPFNKAIATTLCIGRRRPADNDETVFLFVVMVVMHQPHKLSDKLVQEIKGAIRGGLSHRHVPRFVIEVPEIPMTVNGKKIETLVKGIICKGQLPPKVSNTVVNPDCLPSFLQFHSLEHRQAKL